MSLIDRVSVWLTWLIGGALFLTFGWTLMEPFDPMGPVSVLTSDGGVVVLLEAAVLCALCAAVCTVIAGRAVVDVGTFAASLGLAVVSLRGGTTEFLLLYGNGSPDGVMPSGVLATRFAAATLGWFAVVLLAAYVSHAVMRLLFPSTMRGMEKPDAATPVITTIAHDIPLPDADGGRAASTRTVVVEGLKHAGVVAGVGLMAFCVLATGSSERAIAHGQACFVVAAATWLGCYFGHRIAPVRSALWSVLGVGLTACAGYGWAALTSDGNEFPPSIPDSPFLRVLPIQFVGVGAATAISVMWSVHMAALEDVRAGRLEASGKAGQ